MAVHTQPRPSCGLHTPMNSPSGSLHCVLLTQLLNCAELDVMSHGSPRGQGVCFSYARHHGSVGRLPLWFLAARLPRPERTTRASSLEVERVSH